MPVTKNPCYSWNYKWLFQLDDSKSLHGKWLFHQTSIYKWLFRVPGLYVCFFSGFYDYPRSMGMILSRKIRIPMNQLIQWNGSFEVLNVTQVTP